MRWEPVISLGHLVQVAATLLAGAVSIGVCVALGPPHTPSPPSTSIMAHYETFGPSWVAAQIAE